MRRLLLALAICLVPLGGHALSPQEVLDDPALESRAREITRELRCVVCQSESIDDSNADIAKDLRLLVRERIVAGDTNPEVFDYVVARYGEFVLFRPPFSVANAPLWLAGPVLLLFGIALSVAFVRRRARETNGPRPGLSPDEQARLDRLMRE